MAFPYLGEVCALSAAIVWAMALVLFKMGTAHVRPLHLNVFKNVIGMGLLIVTLAVMAVVDAWNGGGDPQDWLTGHEIMVLAISGVLGVAIADTLLFYALHLMGVGLMSVVDCLYAPSVILFSWLMLSESIGPIHILGTGLIICGVLMASRHAPPPDRTRGQLVLGIVLGAGAVTAIAFGIVYAKTVLDSTSVLVATTVRMLAALIPLCLLTLALPNRAELRRVFRPSRAWWVTVPAAVLGQYVALLLWVAGFKYADAAINGILNQTSVIFAVLFATLMLREQLTGRKIAAMAFAFVGVLVVIRAADVDHLIEYLGG